MRNGHEFGDFRWVIDFLLLLNPSWRMRSRGAVIHVPLGRLGMSGSTLNMLQNFGKLVMTSAQKMAADVATFGV